MRSLHRISAVFLPCLLLAAARSLTLPTPSPDATTIVLDGHSKGRIFQGIGAVSAGASSRLLIDYPEPYRSQILDYLFKPDYGASLQHLKVEVGADVNSTDGSEPSHERTRTDRNFNRGYEWWLMEQAHERNPNIILDILPWGAPGWIGDGEFYSPDMAKYIADFIEGAKKYHHLDIQYTGIWNEKRFTPASADYVKELRKALDARGLKTKIVCCDEYPGEHQWRIAEKIRKDPALRSDIAVLTVHYPRTEDGALTTPHTAKASGKPLWSSEDQPNPGGGPIRTRDWATGGRILAQEYNANYIDGDLTATEIWSPVTSYYDILAAPHSGLMIANTPWSGYYNVQSTIWVTAHTTQFAEPGWQYLDSACGYLPGGGSYVTLKSPDKRDWSVILETISDKHPQTVTFKLAGGLSDGTIHIWETNASKIFEHVSDVHPTGGSFTYRFDPGSLYSLTTTTGQHKGDAQPPKNMPFPLPYRDNFEATELSRAPKYLADQDGAFEVHPCRKRTGKCLEQVITQKPIPWFPLPNPFTLAGDENWTDYTVSSDVLLDQADEAEVIGRIDSSNVFADAKALWPSGYVLRLRKNGKWTLYSTQYKRAPAALASGTVPFDATKWHNLALRFHGAQIEAMLDGKQLATVSDKTHTHGMFAIGTDWTKAEFDNLSVRP